MKKQITLNKCLGITKFGELIMVNYIFEHDGEFRGATGARFCPVSQSEIDDRNDIECVKETYGYLWQEAVADGTTTSSEEEYMQMLIDSADGYFLGHDDSYVHYIPDEIHATHYQGYETFECVGGRSDVSFA